MNFWQDKMWREAFEINEFIRHYNKQYGLQLEVLERREKPDYLVQDQKQNVIYGVELTSVYLTDRSVYEEHMQPEDRYIPYDPTLLEQYKKRILHAVGEKIYKARTGYDLTYPLILSIYVNEYISIYFDDNRWRDFAKENMAFFSAISPFQEIVFWNNEAYFLRVDRFNGKRNDP